MLLLLCKNIKQQKLKSAAVLVAQCEDSSGHANMSSNLIKTRCKGEMLQRCVCRGEIHSSDNIIPNLGEIDTIVQGELQMITAA